MVIRHPDFIFTMGVSIDHPKNYLELITISTGDIKRIERMCDALMILFDLPAVHVNLSSIVLSRLSLSVTYRFRLVSHGAAGFDLYRIERKEQ